MTIGGLYVHAQWLSHQNDGADYRDVIEQCHKNLSCIKGRKYKRGSAVKLEEFGCCCVVVWVFRYTL